MLRIEVVRSAELKKGELTQGIVRNTAFEKEEELLFARSRVGKDSIEVEEGDFLHILAGLVYRDVNPDQLQEAVVVNIFVGKGPPVINV